MSSFTYYDSAKGIRISRERAIEELHRHGMRRADVVAFLDETGGKDDYLATEVLDWLGY